MPLPARISVIMARETMSRGARSSRVRRIALHKPFPVTVSQDTSLPSHCLGNQDAEPHDAGGMKLEKFHILQRNAAPGTNRRAIAGIGVGVGGDLEHPAEASGGKEYRLGSKNMDLTGGQLDHHHALAGVARKEQINHLVFVEEGDVIFDALLIEGLQDHMAGSISCIAGTAHWPFAEIAGVSAEAPLIDAAVGCAVEGQAAVLQIVNRLDRLLGQDVHRLLVCKVIAALDGIEGMPFGLILLDIAQSRADSPLGGAGMAANWV